MMRKTEIKTYTYAVGLDDFMVDVVETDYGFECYIYKKDCGIKMLMFCLQERDLDTFVGLVAKNLPEYMRYYMEDDD